MNPCKLLSKIIFILLLLPSFANSQSWQWAKGNGGTGNDGASQLAIDPNGNIYSGVSSMYPTTYFGTDTFTISGFNDMFLVKYDNNGNKLWINQYGGPNVSMINIKQDGISSIIYDSFSNSIISAGVFIESSDFGCTILSSTLEDRQIFLLKTDLNGNCVWSKQAGSFSDDFSYSSAADGSGNIYLTASVRDSATVDTSQVARGGVLAKYDSNGNWLWAKNIFSYTNALGIWGSSIQVGKIIIYSNELYLVGRNIVDSLTIDTAALQLNNYYGNILAKFDLSGNLIWYKYFAGPTSYYIPTLSIDISGNCYITGTFNNGTAIFQTDTIYSTGNADMYLVKYDSNGNKIWLNHASSTLNAYGIGLSADVDGNNYLTGTFSVNANFGAFNISANTSFDMYIARFNSNGDCLGVRQCDNTSGGAIVSDGSGNAIICGSFTNTTNFGSVNLSSYGNMDAFIAKHDIITGIGGDGRIANNQLIIYTNPNAGRCTIKMPDKLLNEKDLVLTIYDAIGRQIHEFKVSSADGKINLNLEEESKGIYAVTLGNSKVMYYGKIVLE
ncbi:MAG: T9SS type A sorting domain-containing protein [Bacteroidetes bacterium]|nr:T9SS type A sorting domain-containing protein [Bacteroidota bacterium]